jgi:nucleoside-diphosphate-sugar epimerase/1-acyl-sn-glycerol-3-phosphate acyltransferase/acyl-CoA-binding protein
MVHPEDDDDDNDPTMPLITLSMSLSQLFDKVATRISTTSSSPSSSNKTTTTDSHKLRLYGLYKFIQEGNCPPGVRASFFQNPTALLKQRAWQACEGMDTSQAQLEYVRLAASLDHVCQDLLDEYEKQQQQQQLENKKNDTDSSKREESKAKEEKEESIQPYTKEEGSHTQEESIAKQQMGIDGFVMPMLQLVASWILPRPIIPRGGLDISWMDLWFAVAACLWSCCVYYYSPAKRRQLEDEAMHDIQGLWKQQEEVVKSCNKTTTTEQQHVQEEEEEVVVGYSVRSLLDLYLLHQNFPPQAGKEVIVVPPINIPGMMQILLHYGLVIVPVDTPSSPTQTNLDLQAVQQAITKRTVAILVVHPFGNSSLSPQGFAQLRAMADQHQIQLWEDAAESFRGLNNNNNTDTNTSGDADITFYSFGLIKTATAMGGGIAILRGSKAADAAAAMRRLQHQHYPQQTTWEYAFHKVCQAIVAKLFSSSPQLYGVLVYMCLQWGGYDFFDRMVTRNLRSIALPKKGQTTTNGWMPSIRKRPSLPLLQVLRRRLQQSSQTKLTVERRIQQCNAMTVLLQRHASTLLAATGELSTDAITTHWLYPIQVDADKKKQIQRYLLVKGWDIAAGTSQLQCVQPTVTLQQTAPLRTQQFMDNILYLPVANRPFTRQQSMELARLLQEATSMDIANVDSSLRSTDNGLRIALCILPVLLLVFWSSGENLRSIIIFVGIVLPKVLRLLFLGYIMALFAAYCMRWLGGSLYLDSSTGVARYCSMLDPMADEGAHVDTRLPKQPTAQREGNEPPPARSHSNAVVIPSLRCLEIPTARQLPGDFLGCAILTGATGFVGSLVLRDLLWHRTALNVTAGVFVICRKKRSHSAKERIDRLLKQDMFSFLSGQEKGELIHVLEGDVTKADAGLSSNDMKRLLLLATQHKVVTRVIHSAASVSFTQELVDAARSNIVSALNMQNLTRQLAEAQNLSEDSVNLPQPKFVHLSTAFVHGSKCGTQNDPLPERLYPLDPYEPAKLYESMLGTQFYASKAMRDLGFHNTYAFTKCVCEHMILQQTNTCLAPVDTMIVRPSIVGPALESPTEGWAGLKPSTIVAAGCLYWSYQWNLWSFGSYDVPCIPVDVLSRFVLRMAFDEGTPKAANDDRPEIGGADATVSEDSFEQVSSCGSVQSLSRCSSNSQGTRVGDTTSCQTYRIYNAAWDSSSAACAKFTWLDYCGATLQVGSIMGYFNRSTAYVGLWITSRLLPHIELTPDTFDLLHTYLVQTPVRIILGLCCLFGWKELGLEVSKLSAFLDLPLLFYPYMNNTFYFQSSLLAPETMDGNRYVFSCIVAAHRFFTKQSSRRAKEDDVQHRPMKFFVIGGQHQQPLSIWWAITQPLGGPMIRIAGWLFAVILRATCHTLSVDLPSFEPAMQIKLDSARERGSGSGNVYLVLAPTHRSFFDFIILSYVAFALPELHIDMPKIAAANDFEDLPVIGWLSEALGAFYLRRGRGRADPELNAKVMKMKEQGTSVFEVFLEGSRSRDRRFLEPRTGLLRSFSDCGGCQVIVPIAISYEKLPEQHILAVEAANHCRRRALNNGGLIRWLLVRSASMNCASISLSAPHLIPAPCFPDVTRMRYVEGSISDAFTLPQAARQCLIAKDRLTTNNLQKLYSVNNN